MGGLISGVLLLACSFVAQLVVWRVRLPRRHTHALLALFAGVPLIVAGVAWAAGHAVASSAAEAARIVLFYCAYSLSYIVIYSAIENESPTLAIVSHVARAGPDGSSDAELETQFGRGTAMAARFAVLERGGWIRTEGDRIVLTTEGRTYARFFDGAARVFGLTLGG